MGWKYRRAVDRLEGHDWPGAYGPGIVTFELDELELGGRAAYLLGDPEQAWWEIHAEQIRADLERDTSPVADVDDSGGDPRRVRGCDLGRK